MYKKRIKGIIYFYKEYTVYNLIFTVLALKLYVGFGDKSYSYMFWLKILGYVSTAIAYYWYRKKYFFFFHNLNLRKRDLIISSFVIDIALFILVFILTYLVLN